MTKRIFDMVGALVGLVLVLPFFVLLPILIKLDSPGPVFFRQVRVGKGFRPFWIYKFRTMRSDPDEPGSLLTIGKDTRITRIGRMLRNLKLDELPQLWNILKGEMSFVGPRPEIPNYVNQFHEKYKIVLMVRPGLTDLATLKYMDEPYILGEMKNPEKEYVKKILPEKLELAKIYVEKSSLLFDLGLLLETLSRMCGLNIRFTDMHSEDNKHSLIKDEPIQRLRRLILKYRRPLIVGVDLTLILLAYYLGFFLKWGGRVEEGMFRVFLETSPWVLVFRGLIFIPFGLYQGLWRYTSIWDLKNIIGGVMISTLAFAAFVRWGLGRSFYPYSVLAIDSLLLIIFLGGIRLIHRIYRAVLHLKKEKRVLIVGAGDAGEMIARDMKNHADSQYEPIGFVDDDVSKMGQRIHGVKVLGTRYDLPGIIRVHNPTEVLIAIPRADSGEVRQIVQSLEPFKVPIKTLPSLRDVIDGKVAVSQIRPLAIEDLLERVPVEMDVTSLKRLIEGKRVLVTGAGGSIGSELCRQISLLEPQALILFDRYENSLHNIGNELAERIDPSIIYPLIGDITDAHRVQEIMAEHQPHIVFHAAAHKHVPLMEKNPGEAVKNNILGTQVVAEAALRFHVERFILISTDKAVNPSSVMGATKRVAELIIQDLAGRGKTHFVTVRFGNVLGSNGSVVPRFLEQIKKGGPVTVTHPEIRRYFMLIPEAVQLVLQATALDKDGAVYVLEMGEQIKLADMARNLIRLSGFVPDVEIPIQYVGLRPGEKMYEELVGTGEKIQTSGANKIFRVTTSDPPNSVLLSQKLRQLEEMGCLGNTAVVIEQLQQLVPDFHPMDGGVEPMPAPDSLEINGGVKAPHQKKATCQSSLQES